MQPQLTCVQSPSRCHWMTFRERIDPNIYSAEGVRILLPQDTEQRVRACALRVRRVAAAVALTRSREEGGRGGKKRTREAKVADRWRGAPGQLWGPSRGRTRPLHACALPAEPRAPRCCPGSARGTEGREDTRRAPQTGTHHAQGSTKKRRMRECTHGGNAATSASGSVRQSAQGTHPLLLCRSATKVRPAERRASPLRTAESSSLDYALHPCEGACPVSPAPPHLSSLDTDNSRSAAKSSAMRSLAACTLAARRALWDSRRASMSRSRKTWPRAEASAQRRRGVAPGVSQPRRSWATGQSSIRLHRRLRPTQKSISTTYVLWKWS